MYVWHISNYRVCFKETCFQGCGPFCWHWNKLEWSPKMIPPTPTRDDAFCCNFLEPLEVNQMRTLVATCNAWISFVRPGVAFCPPLKHEQSSANATSFVSFTPQTPIRVYAFVYVCMCMCVCDLSCIFGWWRSSLVPRMHTLPLEVEKLLAMVLFKLLSCRVRISDNMQKKENNKISAHVHFHTEDNIT